MGSAELALYATMSDSDTLHVGRYVPDSTRPRALTFLLLFVYHSAHSLGKTCAMALLAQVSWLLVVGYTVVDHVFFQLYKLMRGDFIYWAPGVGGPLSSLCRFGAKVVVDFTGASICVKQLPSRSDTPRSDV